MSSVIYWKAVHIPKELGFRKEEIGMQNKARVSYFRQCLTRKNELKKTKEENSRSRILQERFGRINSKGYTYERL